MALSKIQNPLDEAILTGKTPSGLRFILNPKPGFSKTVGIMGVRFGSTDNAFMVGGERRTVPEGTAHFLEHKLFEDEDGDVTDRFSSRGASCNAGTGFNSTSYFFSCTEKLEENLDLLLDFVQTPYFTPELIAKEQGIIGQEIKMYNDDPDWVVFFNLMKCLYREHPVRQNIAGTVEAISTIDAETLYHCHEAFYRPGNMVLVIAGRLDPEALARIICEDGKDRKADPLGLHARCIEEQDPQPAARTISQQMVVARTKVLLGFKDFDRTDNGRPLQKKEIATQMLIDLLFGKSSDNYEELYGDGTIDDSFSASYAGYADFGFTNLGGDTEDPACFRDRIVAVLGRVLKKGVDPENFRRQKNKYLGRFIRTFNAVESSAFSLMNFHFKGLAPTEVMEVIDQTTLEDLHIRLQRHFDPSGMACSIIEPGDLPVSGAGPGPQ